MRVWVYLCVVSSHINIIGRYVMRMLVYLCAGVFSYLNLARYVMRVWVYLCVGVFLYQYHRSVCDENVGLPACWCVLISKS